MFKDKASALAAMNLEMELEKAVRSGIKLTRRKWTGIELVPQALENRAVPIIRKMLADINPEVLGNIPKMNAKVIWEVYWYLQIKPGGVRISFFKLLIELNKNPHFASMFA
ncbi:hypothetical protein KGQ72_00410 [Patescibacteria group bacterium]|nr:hypothetical protein [Patescibacteria group bacterium]